MIFSLLHATARLPNGWRAAADSWLNGCDHPGEVEYILAIHESDSVPAHGDAINVLVFKDQAKTAVNGWNAAAGLSTGRVLIAVADDFFPCPCWDTELLNVIGNLSRECVVDVETGAHPGLITHPIMTRAYYERPGRGGCGGHFYYPDYIHFGEDDDLTEYAWRDGVVITARHLIFHHRHPSTGEVPMDELYYWENRASNWANKEEVLARRKACGFSE